MQKRIVIILSAALAVMILIAGCGLVSGTIFFKKEITNHISSNNTARAMDGVFVGAVVDLTTESDWDQIEIDGVEDMCVRVTVTNRLNTDVSGEVWVTPDTLTTGITDRQGIIDRGGFRVFSGLAVGANATRDFTCSETMGWLENEDQLVDVVAGGRFAVWALGDQDVYNIEYDGIVLGIHVTGSLN
jgi:hypothetical protein